MGKAAVSSMPINTIFAIEQVGVGHKTLIKTYFYDIAHLISSGSS